MNLFESPWNTAHGTENHGRDDNVDATVLNVLHVFCESDDKSFHFDIRMVFLFVENFFFEKMDLLLPEN